MSPAAVALALRARPDHPLADARGRVPVTVRLAPGEDARSLGLLEVAPGIGASWVETGALEAFLEQHPGRRPWVSPPLRLLTDVSAARWTHAGAAHARGRTGQGVVVGVLDTGLDLTHPDLRTADGKTRVAWLLDLSSPPLGLHPELEAAFGCTAQSAAPCRVLSGQDIDARTASGDELPGDTVGHGTHVSSIAAGNGGKDRKYVGVAPDATLVVARVTRGSASESVTDADLLNAVRFVFDRADALGLPAALNVSLGGDYGPHDGTSPLEEGLAAFVGPSRPGRALVVAAGNSGGLLTDREGVTYGVHTETRTVAGAITRAVLTPPVAVASLRGAAYVWVTFQPGDDVKVGVEVNGTNVLGPYPPGGQGASEEDIGVHPYLAVLNGVVADNSPLSPRTNGAVVIADGTFQPGDRIAITLEGSGTAQLWVQGTGGADISSTSGGVLFRNPLKQGTVAVPATHPGLLAVGCTLNRLSWPTLSGPTIQIEQLGSLTDPPGDTVCYFSGAGPNALGVLKPEIASPGAFVAAAMSRDARPDQNPSSMFSSSSGCGGVEDCMVVDAQHGIASGTSMSAPQVTGAVALLLEQKPTLTQPEIVALLQAGARRFEGLVPVESQGGPGALDVDASLELLAP
ncbi:MAG: serine protease, partial [Myxococcales bacterium]